MPRAAGAYHLLFYHSGQCPSGFSWMPVPLEQSWDQARLEPGKYGDGTPSGELQTRQKISGFGIVKTVGDIESQLCA